MSKISEWFGRIKKKSYICARIADVQYPLVSKMQKHPGGRTTVQLIRILDK